MLLWLLCACQKSANQPGGLDALSAWEELSLALWAVAVASQDL